VQDAVLVSVQGNGDVCAQSVQTVCIERHIHTAKTLYRLYYLYAV
jgi:hypothetical protein